MQEYALEILKMEEHGKSDAVLVVIRLEKSYE